MPVFPVETYAAGLVLHEKGLEDGRQGLGDAGKDALVPAFLLGFHHLPVVGHLVGAGHLQAAENVRMPEDHLVGDAFGDIGDVEAAFLLRDAGIKDDVKEHVAKLLAKVPVILLEDGVAELVDFLERHRTEGFCRLGGIPGAFCPELDHDIEKAPEGGQFFFFRMHAIQTIRGGKHRAAGPWRTSLRR